MIGHTSIGLADGVFQCIFESQVYMSARTESEYDILKYGDDYREYMKGVQMWNIARGIIKERGCDIE